MSVLIRYHARAASMLQVGKEVFSPRPAVDSTVVELDFERPWPLRSSRDELFTRVVKGSFSHRRKTILNSLRGYFPAMDREVLTSVLERSGIDPSARGETLSINEFLTLTAIMDLTIS
jgi:16S rRNA (adenine1518-N6/adenine1519-N6)-dimethyltransferase